MPAHATDTIVQEFRAQPRRILSRGRGQRDHLTGTTRHRVVRAIAMLGLEPGDVVLVHHYQSGRSALGVELARWQTLPPPERAKARQEPRYSQWSDAAWSAALASGAAVVEASEPPRPAKGATITKRHLSLLK